MALIYNATFDSGTRILSLLDKAGNVISSCEVPSKELVDDITKPLTLRATQDGSTVKLCKRGSPTGDFQTSRDGGNTWTDYTLDTAITLNTGDEVSFRAKANRTSAQAGDKFISFQMTGKIEAWHNVMSLCRTNDFATYNTVIPLAFFHLFANCTSLTKAPKLPATTLATDCYSSMFKGCQSLTKAPELPATTLANYCYSSMFEGCQSLTKAPELPATTLAQNCYWNMFYDCRSLKEVRIAATKMASNALHCWLKGVSATGDFYCDPNAKIFPTDSESGIPSGWRRLNINEEAPAVDDITKPLTLRATQDGSTVKLVKYGSPSGDFQTSRDGGNTWTDYTLDTAITLNTGDEVSFRAKADRTSAQTYNNYFYFKMTGEIEAWHNVMSLYRTNDFATYNTMVESAFRNLFYNCASLTKAPELPATTLANYYYYYMFAGCQSLTKAPELPATTLTTDCYKFMFRDCQSLTKAPELPATTLANNCYNGMFWGCRSLKEVRIAATTTATDALNGWLSGVSATGDFYCDPNATIFPTDSASGIPANWTRRNIADYPN